MEHCQGFCRGTVRSFSLQNHQKKAESFKMHYRDIVSKFKNDHEYSVTLQQKSAAYYNDQLALIRGYYHQQLQLKEIQILELEENVRQLEGNKKVAKVHKAKQNYMTPPSYQQSKREKSYEKQKLSSLRKKLYNIIGEENKNKGEKTEQSSSEFYQIKINNLITFIKKYQKESMVAFRQENQEKKKKIFNLEKKLFQKDRIIFNFEKSIQRVFSNKLIEFKKDLEEKQTECRQSRTREIQLQKTVLGYKHQLQQIQQRYIQLKQETKFKYQQIARQQTELPLHIPRNYQFQKHHNNKRSSQQQYYDLLSQKDVQEFELKLKKQQCQKLNQELERKKIEVEQLKRQLAELTDKIYSEQTKNSNRELENYQTETKQPESEVQNCSKQEVAGLREKIGQYESILKIQREQNQALERRLEEKKMTESQQISFIKQLEFENQALRKELDAIKRQLQQSFLEVNKLQQQLAIKKQQINKINQEVYQLKGEMNIIVLEGEKIKKQCCAKIIDYQQTLEKKQKQVRALSQQLQLKQIEISELQKTSRDKYQEMEEVCIKEINKERQRLEKNYEQKFTRISQQFEEKSLANECQRHNDHQFINEATIQIVSLKQDIEKLNKQNQTYRYQIKLLSDQLQEVNSEYHKLQSVIKNIKESNSSDIKEFQQRQAILQDQRFALQQQIQNLRVQVKKVIQQKNRYNENFLEAQNKYQQVKIDYHNYKSTIEQKLDQISLKIQEKQQVQKLYGELAKKCQMLQTQKATQKQQYINMQTSFKQELKIRQQELEALKLSNQEKDSQFSKERQRFIDQLRTQKQESANLKIELTNKSNEVLQINKLYQQHEDQLAIEKDNYEQKILSLQEKVSSLQDQAQSTLDANFESQAKSINYIVDSSNQFSTIHQAVHYHQEILLKKSHQLQELRNANLNAQKIIEQYETKHLKLIKKYQSMQQKLMDDYNSFKLDDFLIHSQSKSYVVEPNETGRVMITMEQIEVQESIILRSHQQEMLIQDEDATNEFKEGRFKHIQVKQSIIQEAENEQSTTKKLISEEQLNNFAIEPEVKRKLPDNTELLDSKNFEQQTGKQQFISEKIQDNLATNEVIQVQENCSKEDSKGKIEDLNQLQEEEENKGDHQSKKKKNKKKNKHKNENI